MRFECLPHLCSSSSSCASWLGDTERDIAGDAAGEGSGPLGAAAAAAAAVEAEVAILRFLVDSSLGDSVDADGSTAETGRLLRVDCRGHHTEREFRD